MWGGGGHGGVWVVPRGMFRDGEYRGVLVGPTGM